MDAISAGALFRDFNVGFDTFGEAKKDKFIGWVVGDSSLAYESSELRLKSALKLTVNVLNHENIRNIK